MGKRLGQDFFLRDDVTEVAKDLLGKVIVSKRDGCTTSGIIVETEAYRGPEDKASHAYGGRRTSRTEVMYHRGGTAYVYLCYGIHHLFNVVSAPVGVPHAVLVRAIQPVIGLEVMQGRRGKKKIHPSLTAGPGSLSQALGIRTDWTGVDLLSGSAPVWIEDSSFRFSSSQISSGPRIGIDYAEEYRFVEWRFWLKGSPWVSVHR